MRHDLIVIGGGYAGMAAALQLLRARRHVLVVDEGLRRNRFASHSHGFLSRDGEDPAGIAAEAKAQLRRYPTLTWIDDRVTSAGGQMDGFHVTLADGSRHDGRRLLLATGVKDSLPQIEGLAERWGKSVFDCPYCHGYELDQGRMAIIATGPISLHQARVVADWGPLTLFTRGLIRPDATECTELAARGITLDETPILRLSGHAEIALADGRTEDFAGIFTASRVSPATDLPAGLGLPLEETPMGTRLVTDAAKETPIPGIFAAGDLAKMPHSLSLAVGDGAWAGAQIHHSLMMRPEGTTADTP